VPVSFVAPMRQGHAMQPLSKAGARRLGLPAGIPVAGPYMDHEAGYLSAVGTSKSPLQCSLGTAWVGNFSLAPDDKWTSPSQLVAPAVTGEGWLVVQPLPTGNVAWDWALETLVDRDHGKAIAKLGRIFADDILPPPGVSALPWLNMPNPLLPSTIGAGAFFGVSLHTQPADLVRALAAALTYEMARVLRQVKEKRKVDSVVLGGGASKAAFFRALMAALFHPLPVLTVEDEDQSGARGTLYAFSRKVARAKARRVPSPNRALRERVGEGEKQYTAVFERLYGTARSGGAVRFDTRPKRRRRA